MKTKFTSYNDAATAAFDWSIAKIGNEKHKVITFLISFLLLSLVICGAKQTILVLVISAATAYASKYLAKKNHEAN